ncbi:MAG TPA: methyltransferase domain-containing protein [Desulfuromonadales bacterium]|nr:methyltransferase domain-containing protein [Desulfuromonadales bacterium]
MDAHEWNIPGLLQLAGGFWSTAALHAAVKLDVFTVLRDTSRSADEVAGLCSGNPRATAMLLDALSALGLLEKRGDDYICTPFSAATLSKTSPGYMGHIIMHHHHLIPAWTRLDEAVSSGGPVRESVSHGDDETVRESFLMGMFNLANLLAPKIAGQIDLSSCRQLLDLGGGPGTYAIHFCRANPELSAVVYDLPTTRSFAEKTVASFDLSQRISFSSGDFHADPLPDGFDAAWLSHILHSDGPELCAALLKKAAASLNPGGVLMVQEFILDDRKNGPLFPALFSLNMLVGTGNGRSYSECELLAMLWEAGLSDVHRVATDLPNGAGIVLGHKK